MLRSGIIAGAVIFALGSGVGAQETQRGEASFYGDGEPLNKLTACRELFSPWKIAAAHRTLPCGAQVQVINLANDRSIIVTINDRGPARRTGRVIDVTKRVAELLGFYRAGVARVLVVPLK